MLSRRHCTLQRSRIALARGQCKSDISVRTPLSTLRSVALHRLLASRRSPRRRQSRPRPPPIQTLPTSKRRAAKPRSAPSTRHAKPSGNASAKSAPPGTSMAGTSAKGVREAQAAANASEGERGSGRGPGRRGDEPITTTATSGTTTTDPQGHATRIAIPSEDRTPIAKMHTGSSGESAAAAPKETRQIGMAVGGTETMSGATSAIGPGSRRSDASARVDRALDRFLVTKNDMREPGRVPKGQPRDGRNRVGRRLHLRGVVYSALITNYIVPWSRLLVSSIFRFAE